MPTRPAAFARSAGFTLIELLVVIAIIVLLISMLAPALERAMDAAYTAKCLSNFDALGLGTGQYLFDNRRTYPGHHDSQGVAAWPARLRKYMGNSTKAFNCPTADPRSIWEKRFYTTQEQYQPYYGGLPREQNGVIYIYYPYAGVATPPQVTQYGYEENEIPIFAPNTWFSYGYNDWGIMEFFNPHLGMGGHVGDPNHGEIQASVIVSPQNMIFLGDTVVGGNWDTALDPKVQHPYGGGGTQKPDTRHNGRKNAAILFADGHAEPMEKEALLDLNNNAVRSRWNNDHSPHTEITDAR